MDNNNNINSTVVKDVFIVVLCKVSSNLKKYYILNMGMLENTLILNNFWNLVAF